MEEEAEFKRKLLEKFKEDERLEQYNMIKSKQKEMDYKKEIEKQWTLKLNQYKVQKEYELQMLLSWPCCFRIESAKDSGGDWSDTTKDKAIRTEMFIWKCSVLI